MSLLMGVQRGGTKGNNGDMVVDRKGKGNYGDMHAHAAARSVQKYVRAWRSRRVVNILRHYRDNAQRWKIETIFSTIATPHKTKSGMVLEETVLLGPFTHLLFAARLMGNELGIWYSKALFVHCVEEAGDERAMEKRDEAMTTTSEVAMASAKVRMCIRNPACDDAVVRKASSHLRMNLAAFRVALFALAYFEYPFAYDKDPVDALRRLLDRHLIRAATEWEAQGGIGHLKDGKISGKHSERWPWSATRAEEIATRSLHSSTTVNLLSMQEQVLRNAFVLAAHIDHDEGSSSSTTNSGREISLLDESWRGAFLSNGEPTAVSFDSFCSFIRSLSAAGTGGDADAAATGESLHTAQSRGATCCA